MGTRNLIAVQLNGKYKVAQYGQWDGYLEGQGKDILNFLKIQGNIEKLKNALHKVRYFDKEKDKAFLDSYESNAPKWSNEPDKRTKIQKEWAEKYISRDVGAKILLNIVESSEKEILLKDSITFAGDGLFCEYAYVIDFDKNTFEIFVGFGKEQISNTERFFGFENKEKSEGYFPVRLLKSYPLNNLPTEKELLALEPKEKN